MGAGVPVVRAMPNTPALVGAGASAIAPGSAAGERDLAWAEEVLSAVGVVERVSEPLLDAVTGLSGSGPAYVFLVAEALIEAGVLVGLPRPVSRSLVQQTLLGSARLLAESEDEPERLRAAVTSPGGTTAAGLQDDGLPPHQGGKPSRAADRQVLPRARRGHRPVPAGPVHPSGVGGAGKQPARRKPP